MSEKSLPRVTGSRRNNRACPADSKRRGCCRQTPLSAHASDPRYGPARSQAVLQAPAAARCSQPPSTARPLGEPCPRGPLPQKSGTGQRKAIPGAERDERRPVSRHGYAEP